MDILWDLLNLCTFMDYQGLNTLYTCLDQKSVTIVKIIKIIHIHPKYSFSIFSYVWLLGLHNLIVLSADAVTIALLSSRGLIALTDWLCARIPPTN